MHTLKRLALLRLLAVILGVKFDDLRQREHERERKRKLTWASLAAGLILLIGGGCFGYWEVVRPKTAYYRQLVWRWGAPEGLALVNEETRSHLVASYKVTTRRGQVTEVRREGAQGALRPDEQGQAWWIIHHADDESTKIEAFDRTGRALREEQLNNYRLASVGLSEWL